MVFIFAEFALLGKSFFDPCASASVERIEFRVDGVDAGQETIGRDFFADTFAEVFSEESVAAFVEVADVFRKSGASFDECVDEFEFGDFHVLRIAQDGKNARDFLRLKKYFFSA
jgi:hypothetical protein